MWQTNYSQIRIDFLKFWYKEWTYCSKASNTFILYIVKQISTIFYHYWGNLPLKTSFLTGRWSFLTWRLNFRFFPLLSLFHLMLHFFRKKTKYIVLTLSFDSYMRLPNPLLILNDCLIICLIVIFTSNFINDKKKD